MKDTLKATRNVVKKIQACVTLLLVIFIVALGSLTFLVLRNSELGSFENSFESAAIFLSKGVGDAIDRQTRSGSHVNHLFATAMSRGYSGLLPNFTMPDYEETVDVIGGIAGLRYVAFSPLVTASSRHAWETYAALNADLLGGPPSLTTSTAGSWTIANGICDFGSTGYPLNEKCYPAPSSNSSTYFPIWQVAPIDQNVALVMVDVYSLYAGRATSVIDQAIKYRKPHFTDFETLVQDVAGVDRPSTVMYTPISSNEVGNAVVGLLSGGFSWDDFLSGVLPDEYEKIDCVVSSKTGDLHNKEFSKYGSTFCLNSTTTFDYTITLYPTEEMYFTYVTSKPRNACISVVCIIAFTVFLVLFYGCLVRRQENIINEFTKLAFADDVTRDAVLLAKKIYVRYISHEMRTPLNAAYLGLKIVEKDLIAKKGTFNMDTVATVRDVMDACDIAIEFLNDLLNYDKLENRTLMIEKKSVVALPFILSTIKLFNIQAEEKGINLVLDVEDNGACVLMEGGQSLMYSSSADAVDDHDLWRNQGRGLKLSLTHSAYVGADECISIDENKMSQVIRNLISNAMKFTPGGRTVTIRVRKEVRNPGRNVDAAFNDLSLSLSLPQSMKRRSIFQPIWGTSTRTVTPTRTVAPTRAGSVANSRANSRRLATPPGRYQNEIVREGFWPPTGVSSNSVFPDIPEQVSVFFSRREAKEKVIEYDTLVLDVIDEGVGMVAEDSRRVFKDVIQFDPSQLQTNGGSGLGLVIAKALVDMHGIGAEISAYSAGAGEGCRFTLRIPLISLEPVPDTPKNRSNISPSFQDSCFLRKGYEEMGIPPDFMGRRQQSCTTEFDHDIENSTAMETDNIQHLPLVQLQILVVDDSKLNRRMLSKLLQSSSHICDEASDGLEAVMMFKDRLRNVSESEEGDVLMYDAILMDFMMPNMDGPTATREIRELGFKGLILGITGANQVLLKPVNLTDLEIAINSLTDIRNRNNLSESRDAGINTIYSSQQQTESDFDYC